MPEAVYDFKSIAKIANLKALEGRNQNEVKPVEVDGDLMRQALLASSQHAYDIAVEMPCDSNPQDSEYFYGVGFVAEQDGA